MPLQPYDPARGLKRRSDAAIPADDRYEKPLQVLQVLLMNEDGKTTYQGLP